MNQVLFDEIDALPESADFMLTTYDNPYNPYTQWDEWQTFDRIKGYNSMNYLARVTTTSSDMPEEWNDIQARRGIEEIIRIDPFNWYCKINKAGKKYK